MSLKTIPKKSILVGGLIILFFGFGIFLPNKEAFAQSAPAPQFFVTWKPTASYTPPNYIGKALPSYGTKVTAELELVSNGRVLDISDQTIYWYLEDTLIGGGTGVQQLTFPLFGRPPGFLRLKIELPTYNGQYLIHTVDVPYANPTAVIYAPYPGGSFSSNPITLTALPYFFNTTPSNLSYTWAVNGQTGSNAENPQSAEVTLPQGTPSGTGISVSVNVKSPSNSFISNTQSTLIYNSQL